MGAGRRCGGWVRAERERHKGWGRPGRPTVIDSQPNPFPIQSAGI